MNKENFSLTYFISRTLFFGTIYSIMLNNSGSDSIIASILGTIIGIGIIWLIHQMKISKDSYQYIQLFTYSFLIILSLTSLEIYVNSFLLTSMPRLITVIPAVILGIYCAFKDIKTIRRSSFIFLCISILSFILIDLCLSKYFFIDNVLPFFTYKTKNIIKSALTFGILSAGPNILLKDENIKLSKHILYYIIVSLLNIINCFFILAALTPNVAKIYSFPEYMVLKRIKILEFIENIENLVVLIWYFDYFFLITLSFKRIYNILKNKAVFITLISLITIFTSSFIVNSYTASLYLYHHATAIMTTFIIMLSLSCLKKKV